VLKGITGIIGLVLGSNVLRKKKKLEKP